MAPGAKTEDTMGRKPKAPSARCEICPLAHRPFVPTSGPGDATILVLGEAPGEVEAKQGKPFVGPSGRLLDQLLAMNGIRRADIALANTVSCHPLKNADPPREAIEACRGYLDHEIRRRPVAKILALGKFAAQQALASRSGILKLRVGPPKDSPHYSGVKVVPSIHPAATFRNGDWYPHLVSDIGKLAKPQAKWIEPTYEVADDAPTVLDRLRALSEVPEVFVDTEWAADLALLAIGIAWAPDRVLVVGRNALADHETGRVLGNFLVSRRVSYHNGRADVPVLRRLRPDLQIGGDSMLASYCLDERTGIHSLDWCSQEHLGTPEWKSAVDQYAGAAKNKDYSKVPLDILYKYNALDTATGFQLLQYFEQQIRDQGRWELPYQYMLRVASMLMEVESAGLEVDIDNLEHLEQEYQEKLDTLESKFTELEINPRSPKQIVVRLAQFGVMTASSDAAHLIDIKAALEGEKKREATHSKFRIIRATCQPQQRKQALDLVDRLLTYRKHHKMYATYIKGVRDRLVEAPGEVPR